MEVIRSPLFSPRIHLSAECLGLSVLDYLSCLGEAFRTIVATHSNQKVGKVLASFCRTSRKYLKAWPPCVLLAQRRRLSSLWRVMGHVEQMGPQPGSSLRARREHLASAG